MSFTGEENGAVYMRETIIVLLSVVLSDVWWVGIPFLVPVIRWWLFREQTIKPLLFIVVSCCGCFLVRGIISVSLEVLEQRIEGGGTLWVIVGVIGTRLVVFPMCCAILVGMLAKLPWFQKKGITSQHWVHDIEVG